MHCKGYTVCCASWERGRDGHRDACFCAVRGLSIILFSALTSAKPLCMTKEMSLWRRGLQDNMCTMGDQWGECRAKGWLGGGEGGWPWPAAGPRGLMVSCVGRCGPKMDMGQWNNPCPRLQLSPQLQCDWWPVHKLSPPHATRPSAHP